MRKTAMFLLMLLLISGGIYAWRTGVFDQLLKGRGEPPQTVRESTDDSDKTVKPVFGTVRAEASGELLVAGWAEPGWTVTVESNGVPVGTVTATENGSWLILPAKPLAKGEHTLRLKAQDPMTARTLFSKQSLALSLTPGNTDRPLTAIIEEGKPTRVLQKPLAAANMAGGDNTSALGAPAEQGASNVSFGAVDYEDAGARSKLHLSGMASPSTQILLYVNNEYLGTVTAEPSGRWNYSGNRELPGRSAYVLRADVVESGKVVARAEVNFDRDPQRAVALAEAPKTAPDGGVNSERPDTTVLQTKTAAKPEKPVATLQDAEGNVIVVRRGDTLWRIAKRLYGSGEKYTQIFESNRGQIRNPNLIYPDQRFSVKKQ